jgi:hypothetical protein
MDCITVAGVAVTGAGTAAELVADALATVMLATAKPTNDVAIAVLLTKPSPVCVVAPKNLERHAYEGPTARILEIRRLACRLGDVKVPRSRPALGLTEAPGRTVADPVPSVRLQRGQENAIIRPVTSLSAGARRSGPFAAAFPFETLPAPAGAASRIAPTTSDGRSISRRFERPPRALKGSAERVSHPIAQRTPRTSDQGARLPPSTASQMPSATGQDRPSTGSARLVPLLYLTARW